MGLVLCGPVVLFHPVASMAQAPITLDGTLQALGGSGPQDLAGLKVTMLILWNDTVWAQFPDDLTHNLSGGYRASWQGTTTECTLFPADNMRIDVNG